MAYVNCLHEDNIKICYQKVKSTVKSPELSDINPATITLRAKENFSFEKNKYAKAYTGLIMDLPTRCKGVVSPLSLRENETIGDLLIYQSMQVIEPGYRQEIAVELFNRTKNPVIIEKDTPIGYLTVSLKPQDGCKHRVTNKFNIHLEEVNDMTDLSYLPVRNSGEISLSEIMI